MDDLLFQHVRIGSMSVKNRFSMGAAIDHMDNDPEGRVKRFAELARGGVGLIVSGATNLADTGTWHKVVEAVHKAGAKFAIQLIADKIPGAFVAPLPKDHPLFTTLVPSLTYTENHRGLTEGEIEGFIEGYAHRAQNAKSIGADAIEIHAAHTSLPSQFLSPLTNRRDDKWGGSLENRARFHMEVLKAIRAATGPVFPVIIKLGAKDPEVYREGLGLEDGKKAAMLLAEAGCDALEISQGIMEYSGCDSRGKWFNTPLRAHIKTPEEEAYFRDLGAEIKRLVAIPVLLTGGMKSYDVMHSVIETGCADMISLCRALLREPGLINRFMSGDRSRSLCTSCNQCAIEGTKAVPLACIFKHSTSFQE